MPRIDLPESDSSDLAQLAFRTHAPEIGAQAAAFSLAVYQKSKMSLRELEAARFRTAQINGCNICQKFRGARDLGGHLQRSGGSANEGAVVRGTHPDEAFYSAVKDWAISPLFSARERIAIEMAERMGERPHSMEGDEDFWDRVHASFTDSEIVDMTLSIASWMALGRVVHTLELDNVCMPTFDAQAA